MNKKLYFWVSCLLILFAGCHHHSHESHSHEGHSHHTNLMLSAYNDSFELFAEAEPFATGKTSEITVYLTRLSDFRPQEVSSLKLNLLINGSQIQTEAATELTKGVYRIVLNPKQTGAAVLQFDIQTTAGQSSLEIPSVRIYDDAHKAEHIAEDENPENPDAIAFPKTRQWKVDFGTALPVSEKFGQLIKTTAQIQSSPSDEIRVAAKASGIVFFSGSSISEGLSVNAGQQLFLISDAGLAENNAGVRFSEARANFTKAEASYNRAKLLIEDQIISQKEFLEAQTEFETAKALYENLSRSFSANGQKISSPISGYVKQMLVGNGEFVEEGQILFTVSKNKNLLLKAEVRAKYAPLLSQIASATVASMDKNRFYTLEELDGKILSYGKALSENYLIPVSFEIAACDGFLPGGLVDMYIRTESDKEVLTIPATSLTEEQGLYFVYIQHHPESFEKRNVQIGASDGIRTEITSGLNVNERIVSKGAISVKLAQSAGALDPHAGHIH